MAVQPADVAVDARVAQAQAGYQPGHGQALAAHDGDQVLFVVLPARFQQRTPGVVVALAQRHEYGGRGATPLPRRAQPQAALAVAVGRVGCAAVGDIQPGEDRPAWIERAEPGGVQRCQLAVVVAGKALLAIALALPVSLQLEQAACIQGVLPFRVHAAAALQRMVAQGLVVIAGGEHHGLPCTTPAVTRLHVGIELVVRTVPAPCLAEGETAHVQPMMPAEHPAPFQAGVVVEARRALGVRQFPFDDAGVAHAEQAGATGRTAVDVVTPCRAGGQRAFPALARLQGTQVTVHARADAGRGRIIGIDACSDGCEQRGRIAIALVFRIDTCQLEAGRQEIRLRRQQRFVLHRRGTMVACHPRQRPLRIVAQQGVMPRQFDVLIEERSGGLPLLMLQREVKGLAKIIDGALHAQRLAVDGDGRPLRLGLLQALLVLLLVAQFGALFKRTTKIVLLGAHLGGSQQQYDKENGMAHGRSVVVHAAGRSRDWRIAACPCPAPSGA
ncbi:hypothetical protein SMJ63A_100061 [Stenotrophomonas geniculata]